MNERILDREMEISQEFLDRRIAETAATAGKAKLPTGRCVYCNEVVPSEMSFCPPEAPGLPGCRDDYDAEMAAKARNGAYRRI